MSKLDAFWSYLKDFASSETGAKYEVTAQTMRYLQTLGESHAEKGLVFVHGERIRFPHSQTAKIFSPESIDCTIAK